MIVFDDVLNGGTLSTLLTSVRQQFQSLTAQLQTSWLRQHDRAGAHTAVTAQSLRVTGASSLLQSLMLGPAAIYNANPFDTTLTDVWVPELENATILKMRNVASATTVSGIQPSAAGGGPSQVGRVLLLINDSEINSPRDFDLSSLDTASTDGYRFIGGAASRAPWTLHGSEMCLLVYDVYYNAFLTSAPTYGWRVLIG